MEIIKYSPHEWIHDFTELDSGYDCCGVIYPNLNDLIHHHETIHQTETSELNHSLKSLDTLHLEKNQPIQKRSRGGSISSYSQSKKNRSSDFIEENYIPSITEGNTHSFGCISDESSFFLPDFNSQMSEYLTIPFGYSNHSLMMDNCLPFFSTESEDLVSLNQSFYDLKNLSKNQNIDLIKTPNLSQSIETPSTIYNEPIDFLIEPNVSSENTLNYPFDSKILDSNEFLHSTFKNPSFSESNGNKILKCPKPGCIKV